MLDSVLSRNLTSSTARTWLLVSKVSVSLSILQHIVGKDYTKKKKRFDNFEVEREKKKIK